MPRRQWLFIATMGLVIAAIAIREWSFRVPNPPPAYHNADYNTHHGAPSDGGNGIFRWAFEHPDTFFAGIVAVFTFVLATSTALLWIETFRSGGHQREEMAGLLATAKRNAAAAADQAKAMDGLRVAAEAQQKTLAKQAADTQTIAEAAKKTAEVAEQSLVGLERPYIFLGRITGHLSASEDYQIIGDKPQSFRVQFDLDNKGRTFAIVRAINRTILFDRSLSTSTPPYNFAHTLHGGESIIAPGTRAPDPPHNFQFDDFISLGIHATQDREYRERAFFFFGFIIYEDFLANKWKKGFGFIYSPRIPSFIPYGGSAYNYDREYEGEDDAKFPEFPLP